MSSRHHIDDFMRGRIIGKIEEGRKITDVAREFDIAHSVVSRLWKSFKTTGMCNRRHGGGRVRSTTTPAEYRYIVLSAKRNRRTTAQQHRTARLQSCREHHNWTEQDWACVLFSDESRFGLSSDCRRQLIWRESGTAYRPENIQEKDRYPTCSIMVWAGIMINSRTRLHVVANGTMTRQRYIDEVLLPHVRLFRGAVGDKFVFMDDNATCHRTFAVQDCLDSEGIQRLVWPARSLDLNPIANVWDALGSKLTKIRIFKKIVRWNCEKLFIQTELQINSWEKLKQALIDDFSFEINSASLQELLRNRKIRDCETALECFLKMKELCNSGKIDDSALMYYVIQETVRIKNKGIKCFRCEVFGHTASECPDNNDTKLDVANLIINKEETLTKKVLIDDLILDDLIDSGSRVTLFRKSVYDKINHVQLFPLNTTLRGFSNSKVRLFGYFKDDIQIDELKCNVEICVVVDDAMLFDVIIGLNVLIQGETIINENGIAIKNKPKCTKEVATLSALPINLSPDDIEINIAPDIPHIYGRGHRGVKLGFF
ncbi:retrovirus-related Pol polyprotein from transposon 297 [Trichonephila clavipes]|nr:retrovirus-related Pol polyprotein from transposon 297 [Trichonephila clavipes]